jgi:hypothetical protein
MPKLEEDMTEEELFLKGFERSKRGNLWRHYRGLNITVFERGDGYYSWSIGSTDGVRFSPGWYEEEGDALASLWDELQAPSD